MRSALGSTKGFLNSLEANFLTYLFQTYKLRVIMLPHVGKEWGVLDFSLEMHCTPGLLLTVPDACPVG